MSTRPAATASPSGVRRGGSGRGAGKADASGRLDAYSARRAFAVTPEPAPEAAGERTGPLLFVVQQHAARQRHYDFRLELDGVLKSWAVPKGPSLDPDERRLAVLVEDHPYAYAAFEGVIPARQYGAGEVIVWDCGAYSPDEGDACWFHDRAEAERRVREALAAGKLSLFLRGEKLKGSFALVRGADAKNWLLIKHRDRFVATDVAGRNRSVVSGLTLEELKDRPAPAPLPARRLAPDGPREAMPARLSPMLAEAGEAPFSHADWLFEPKLDGYRVLAFVTASQVVLRSRRGLDLTGAFPEIAAELATQAVAGMIVDGEIVAIGPDGKPSFNALQNRAQLRTEREIAAAARATPAIYYAVDLPHFAGLNLRQAPYTDRRRYLGQCLLPDNHLRLVHASDDGESLYPAALANGFEGIMAKRRDSPYLAGRRSGSWLKIKSSHSAEFIVAGYTRGRGARAPLGALLLGYWRDGGLRYAGHVGSGLDAATLTGLKDRFAALATDASAFAEPPPLHRATTWLKPELVAEVRFAEWTPDGLLRAPVFLRLRDDVDARRVVRADTDPRPAPSDEVLAQLDDPRPGFTLAIGEHRLRLTHLDRVYWPADPALGRAALTKRDLLRYYARIAPFLLPHLADRPLTMIRMPEGIAGERFYQKHWDGPLPGFARAITVFSASKDERQDYLLCDNLPTLLWLAQAGTLEFHVWHSRARPGPDAAGLGTDYAGSAAALKGSLLNHPDYLLFDLDPYVYSGREAAGEEPEFNPAGFDKCRELAFLLRELLQAMGLFPIVKTSGKTGLHVFVPIERSLDFAAARQVCAMVGQHLLRRHPRLVTLDWSVARRSGRIFIDCNMNVRGKTLCAAYSPRGSPGAPVSMPLAWDELAVASPLDFNLGNVADRLARNGDRWHDALTRKQSLERVLSHTP